jgi:hypothetical protein
MKSLRRPATVAAVAGCTLAGLLAPGAQAQSAEAAIGTATATCVGTEHLCGVSFSLAGGASNKRLNVRLPGTNMRLINRFATPMTVRTAYSLSAPRFSLGGSLWSVTLNAVASIRAPARLAFVFGDPTTTRRCPTMAGGLASQSVTIQITGYVRSAFTCTQVRAVGSALVSRFRQHLSLSTLVANRITYHCRLVPGVPRIACTGGGTLVRFNAPTGR